MLSCYGFAVLAHNMLGAGHSHSEPQTAQATQTLIVSVAFPDTSDRSASSDIPAPAEAQKAPAAGDVDNSSDDTLSLDEAGSEHAELVDARNGAPALLRFTEQPPKLGLTTIVSPFLARPKRPPRAASLVA